MCDGATLWPVAHPPPSEPDQPAPSTGRPPLPRADRITAADRLRSGLRRSVARVRCRFGLHDWAYRRNPDVGGASAVFHQCRRCGREYSPPDPRQTWF